MIIYFAQVSFFDERHLKQHDAVIHKISIQAGSVISDALFNLNRHIANDRLILMTVSCCLKRDLFIFRVGVVKTQNINSVHCTK